MGTELADLSMDYKYVFLRTLRVLRTCDVICPAKISSFFFNIVALFLSTLLTARLVLTVYIQYST